MKRIILLLSIMLFATFSLVGCNKYTSHYSAVMHVHSNRSESASTSFKELKGTEVFRLKCKGEKAARIRYSGKLESGSLTVYYDCGEAKNELFSVHSGEETDAYSDQLTDNSVYIIIETDGKCENGEFNFEIIYD